MKTKVKIKQGEQSFEFVVFQQGTFDTREEPGEPSWGCAVEIKLTSEIESSVIEPEDKEEFSKHVKKMLEDWFECQAFTDEEWKQFQACEE